MPVVVCVDLPKFETPPEIRFVTAKLKAFRADFAGVLPKAADAAALLDKFGAALAPLDPMIRVILIVAQLVNCIIAIVRAVKRPTPGRIRKAGKCPRELVKLLKEFVLTVPPFPYFKLIKDAVMILVAVLDDLIVYFRTLEAQLRIAAAAIARATLIGDTSALTIAKCAENDIKVQASHAMGGLQAIGSLISLLVLFFAVVGGNPGEMLDRIDKATSQMNDFSSQLDQAVSTTVLTNIVNLLMDIRIIVQGVAKLAAAPLGEGVSDLPAI